MNSNDLLFDLLMRVVPLTRRQTDFTSFVSFTRLPQFRVFFIINSRGLRLECVRIINNKKPVYELLESSLFIRNSSNIYYKIKCNAVYGLVNPVHLFVRSKTVYRSEFRSHGCKMSPLIAASCTESTYFTDLYQAWLYSRGILLPAGRLDLHQYSPACRANIFSYRALIWLKTLLVSFFLSDLYLTR